MKQAGNYNENTYYLILHIRKTYKNGRDNANTIENQEPFNFDSSAPKLNILTTVETTDTSPEEKLEIKHGTVETTDTSPEEKLEIKHENDQYRIEFEGELQLNLKKKVIITPIWGSICILIWAMHNRPTA